MTKRLVPNLVDTTLDTLFDGKLQIYQPAKGYRFGIDPILLAAFCPAKENDKVLDLGCGVGTAFFCLVSRIKKLNGIGLEINHELANLATQNVHLNKLEKQVEIITGDLLYPPKNFAPQSFDHIITNPPFFSNDPHNISPYTNKKGANMECYAKLKDFIDFTFKYLKTRGTLTLIYRTDRLQEIMTLLPPNKWGEITIYPLWANQKGNSKLLLVRAKKLSKTPTIILKGLNLHSTNNKYTSAANNIIRKNKAIKG